MEFPPRFEQGGKLRWAALAVFVAGGLATVIRATQRPARPNPYTSDGYQEITELQFEFDCLEANLQALEEAASLSQSVELIDD